MTDNTPQAATAAMLNEDDASVFLAVPVPTLRGWRHRGGGPHFVKMGRLVRYPRSELESFVAANMRRTTSDQR